MTDELKKPLLTLPPMEAEMLKQEYGRADCILEYGSGGSTVLASELPGKQIISVESDANWVKMMQDWLNAHPGMSPVSLQHSDIGPTREWGYPQTDRFWRNFLDYPFKVWSDHPDLSPDVVLIDGRFRVGCFIATLMNIKKECVILFDDYLDRPAYHVAERFMPIDRWAGRMARFEVSPNSVLDMPFPELVKLCQNLQ